jgi:hypothetical protein
MATSGLHGPGELTEDDIDEIVLGVGPGAYVLGRKTSSGFYIDYVGRSDTDLNDRLKKWVGTKYTHFKYGFYDTAEAAFLKECHLYHDWGGGTANLDNKVHPARPKGSNAKCPIDGCDVLD